MSNGRNQRTGKGSGGGGGGGNQQRRRRGRSSGGGAPQMPRGPVMTALGESTYEAVFDHGGEGYGVWFDGIVREDPVYRQFWKGTGTRPIFVKIEQDRIMITRDQPGSGRSDAAGEASTDAQGGSSTPMSFEPDAPTSMTFEPDAPSSSGDADAAPADADDPSGERVYSAEEAARLFADAAATEEAGNGSTTSRRVSTRRSSTPDEGTEEAAPRRTTRTRRTRPTADAADAEGGAASDD